MFKQEVSLTFSQRFSSQLFSLLKKIMFMPYWLEQYILHVDDRQVSWAFWNKEFIKYKLQLTDYVLGVTKERLDISAFSTLFIESIFQIYIVITLLLW